MSTDTYIIAVKRERRGSEPADWKEQIGHTSGIEVLSSNTSRLQVRASDESINRFRPHYGDLLHIEKLIVHRPQTCLGCIRGQTSSNKSGEWELRQGQNNRSEARYPQYSK
jgi:hypothetical protein